MNQDLSMKLFTLVFSALSLFLYPSLTNAQIGSRFNPEKKIIEDPETGYELIFLTNSSAGDSKIYPTHPQWTADGKWVIFRSNRVPGEAMAVNEESGAIIQITEGGYIGMLNIATKSMHLYLMRPQGNNREEVTMEIVQVNLTDLFKDSVEEKIKSPSYYQKVVGTIPPKYGAMGDMALDGDEKSIYFRIGNKKEAGRHLDPELKIESDFGPRNMGEGPGGIARLSIESGEIEHVVSVPFQVGHIQGNPWNPGEIVFCWETGGKSPQRTWTVKSDGSGLRPLYPEADYEWVTHEAVISEDEVVMAIMGHRDIEAVKNNPDENNWGPSGTREKPTGLAIVNLKTRKMIIAGQTKSGSGLWHVHGSSDGRWAVGDDFSRSIYLIDRNTREMKLLSAGHKSTAADHPHPSFNADGTKIIIQSAMLAEDGRSMDICVIPVPENWLKRSY